MNCTPYIAIVLTLLGLQTVRAAGLVDHTGFETLTDGTNMIAYETGDTVDHAVFSYGQLGISGSPVFLGPVSLHAAHFYYGFGFNPRFLGGEPRFQVPAPLPVATTADSVREVAQLQNHYYQEHNQTYHAGFRNNVVMIWHWPTGTPPDSTQLTFYHLSTTTGTCIFVDAPLEIEGTVTGRVTIGSSHNILIMNNLMYSNSRFPSGEPTDDNPAGNMLGIVSEGDVKVANTAANGRNNSNGMGQGQGDPNSTDITIAGHIVALGGSFTFDQQNDADSGYVCPCIPDNRGLIYLWGSVTQFRRGYFHRTNNNFTGYHAKIHFDCRINSNPPPTFKLEAERDFTDSLNFGDVAIGTTKRDTATINTLCPGSLGAVSATLPFHAERVMPFSGSHFIIPTSFAPTQAGQFTGQVSVTFDHESYTIVLRGRGTSSSAADSNFILHPSSLWLAASPNPFNGMTTLRYSLPSPGNVRLDLFDVNGRNVRTLAEAHQSAGAHMISLDCDGLPSGVYFARLTSLDEFKTCKLLLMK